MPAMLAPNPHSAPANALSAAERIDSICDAFEMAWQGATDEHTRPQIEDFLAREAPTVATGGPLVEDVATGGPLVATQVRLELIQELTHLDIYYRRKLGESPTEAEYAERFSELNATWLAAALALDRPLSARDTRRIDRTRADESTLHGGVGGKVDNSLRSVRIFGDYELLSEIARGGMGVVYKARQISLNRVVALKMILSGEFATPEEVERFRLEAESAARLDHPGIVPIYEVGEHEGHHFFSMGYVAGESLGKLVAAGPMPPRDAAQIVRDVAEAVQYAHEQGVVHRDLKPANVLLQRKDEGRRMKDESDSSFIPHPSSFVPRITDFGLAKRLSEESGRTRTGQVLGTPSYMPPEQAAGKLEAVGPLSDVYSLGAILYTLLTGRPPFQSSNPVDTLRQVLERDPLPPRQLNPAVPRDLQSITLKCLEKRPRQRYQAADELADDLRRFLMGDPVRARSVTPGVRVVRWIQRRPLVTAIAGSCVLALFLCSGMAYFWRDSNAHRALASGLKESNKKRANEDRQNRLENYSSNMALHAAMLNDYPGLPRAIDLDEFVPKSPAEEDVRGFEWHLLDELLRKGTTTISSEDARSANITSLALSPDGQTLAVGRASKEIELRNAETSEVYRTLTMQEHESGVEGLAFSPDGNYLAAAGGRGRGQGGICVWETATWQILGDEVGEFGLQKPKAFRNLRALAFAPGGNELIFSESSRALGMKLDSPGNGSTLRWKLDSQRAKPHRPDLQPDSPETALPLIFVAASPKGQIAVSRGDYLQLWNLDAGEPTLTFDSLSAAVEEVSFSPDSKLLAASDNQQRISIFDTSSGRRLFSAATGSERILSLVFTPDSRLLLSAGTNENLLKVWQVAPLREQIAMRGIPDLITALQVDAVGKRVYIGCSSAENGAGNGVLRRWAFPWPRSLRAHVGTARGIAFSPDSITLLTTGTQSEGALVRDVASGKSFSLFPERSNVACVAFSKVQAAYALGDRNNVRVFHAKTHKEIATLKWHRDVLRAVAWSPDDTYLSSTGKAGTVRIWSVNSYKPHWEFEFENEDFPTAEFSPDGKLFAAGSTSGTVRIWSIADLVRLNNNAVPAELRCDVSAHCIAFSPDSNTLASSNKWGIVTLWDLETHTVRASLKRHATEVNALAWSPDGKTLASGDDAGIVHLWQAESGEHLLKLNGYVDQIKGMAFSPDGQHLALTGRDGQVRMWTAPRTQVTMGSSAVSK